MTALRATLVVVVLLLLVLGMARLAFDQPVGSVRIEGHLTLAERAAVRTVLTDRLDTGLLGLDLQAVIGSVQALSWPQSVQARRVWPDTLVVSVVKQEPVALWSDGRYLTSNGRVVKIADAPEALPQLLCSISSPPQALAVYQRLARSAQWSAEGIERLEETPLGEWRARLHSGVDVMLGAGAPQILQRRLQRFFALRGELPAARASAVRYADVRYNNGVALRFEPSSLLATSQ